ncbi:3TM-type holin [Roseivivax marinus]|uniref:3TM-type holin n=1 Tax=Roseivivax marinus TaxID=1379903 RepID=UPI001F03737D|nr:3TM-type holin [Roseivivax marinus]UMA63531.1 3TM-type holin [Roseivivax marinus]
MAGPDVRAIAKEIVAREGGYVDDPDDPGGATNFGVTIGTMTRLGIDLDGDGRVTRTDVKRLTRDQAVEIFLTHYFARPRIAALPEPLQATVFDMYVNAGTNAVKILQRLPRPAMALGTLALFVAAMIDPTWFAARMTGIALVPEPLWWLLGAVVSFYFGARHQAKGQDFRREIAATMAAAPEVAARLRTIEALRGKAPEAAAEEPVAPRREMAVFGSTTTEEENAALAEWRRSG